MQNQDIIMLFHHLHHKEGRHVVHHCGGKHREVDPDVDYTIKHCDCGKHKIDKERATGHATGADGLAFAVKVHFLEACPDGGWHIESGRVANKQS